MQGPGFKAQLWGGAEYDIQKVSYLGNDCDFSLVFFLIFLIFSNISEMSMYTSFTNVYSGVVFVLEQSLRAVQRLQGDGGACPACVRP